MFTWSWRAIALVALCGVSLWGLYRTNLQRIEQALSSLLQNETTIGAMQLDVRGRISRLSNLEIAGGDLATCTLASVELHSAPWSMASQQPRIEKAVGSGVHIASSDRWAHELHSVAETIGTIDPVLRTPMPMESVDIAAETDKAMEPLMVSWRGEWQGVLANYAQQIDVLNQELMAVDQTHIDTSNPLRDRELIKSQLASIERLTKQFEQIETQMQASRTKLTQRVTALQEEGQLAIEQRIRQKEKELQERFKDRIAKNLEALRGQLFAKLINEACQRQHVVSNLAHRGTRMISGKYTITPDRGTDMLDEFTETSPLKLHCLELIGSCSQIAPTEFLGAFYPDEDSQADSGKFFVVCRDANRTSGHRFTGTITGADQYQFNGTIPLAPATLATGLLTDPNFELAYDGAELDMQTVASSKGRHLELQWRASNASLKTVISDKSQTFDLDRSPLSHKDCLATLRIPLDGDHNTPSDIEQHDNFFAAWNLQVVEGCSETEIDKASMLAERNPAIKLTLDREYAQAIAGFNTQTTKMAVLVSSMDSRQQRLAAEIQPRQIRTANQSNMLQR
jgi:hypothetical protein